MQEKLIQQAVITTLQYHENMGGCYFIRNNAFQGRIQRPNGSQGYIKNAKPGSPDILVLYKGRFIGIEIKSETGKQTANQMEAEEKIRRAGGEYYVVRSVEDLLKILN